MTERLALVVLCLALVSGGAFAWWLRLQPPLEVDVSPLETLPVEVDGWHAVDLEIDDRVAEELAADFNVQRVYRHPTGHLIWLYVGYYSTARGGRPEHTPRGCYTGAGWELVETGVLDVPDGRVREFLVRRGADYRLVHFWFRSHRRGGMTGGIDLGVDRVLGKLTTGRADGGLIRISTPIRSRADAPAARSRLAAFRAGLVPQLEARWPDEGPGMADQAQDGSGEPAGGGTAEPGSARAGRNDARLPGSNRESRITSGAIGVTYDSTGSGRISAATRRPGKGSPVGLHSGPIPKAE